MPPGQRISIESALALCPRPKCSSRAFCDRCDDPLRSSLICDVPPADKVTRAPIDGLPWRLSGRIFSQCREPGVSLRRSRGGAVDRRHEQVEVAVVVVVADRETAGRDRELNAGPGLPRNIGQAATVVPQQRRAADDTTR